MNDQNNKSLYNLKSQRNLNKRSLSKKEGNRNDEPSDNRSPHPREGSRNYEPFDNRSPRPREKSRHDEPFDNHPPVLGKEVVMIIVAASTVENGTILIITPRIIRKKALLKKGEIMINHKLCLILNVKKLSSKHPLIMTNIAIFVPQN